MTGLLARLSKALCDHKLGGLINSTCKSIGWKLYEIRFLDSKGAGSAGEDVTWTCSTSK